MFKTNKKITSFFLIAIVLLLILAPLSFTHGAEEQCFGAFTGLNVSKCLTDILAWFLGLALSVAGLILGVMGVLLNFVMNFTVIEMSEHLKDISGINVAWTAFRDLANMFFIFILLYIAIGTILRLDSVNTKKLLVHVILIALLLNFSLFFTKVVIDASNILTIGFHDAIVYNDEGGGVSGLSDAFMQPLGFSTFYDVLGAQNVLSAQGDKSTLSMLFLAGLAITLFLTTSFVFLMASLMFIMRYLVLIFLMILSPLAFLAMALPKSGQAKKWWDALISQALFAPVFMALLWVALIILQSIMGTIAGAKYTDVAIALSNGEKPPDGTLALIMNFMIIIGTIIFALIVSRQISSAGAGSITQFGQKTAGRWAGNLAGATARTGLIPLQKAHEGLTRTRFFQGGGVGEVKVPKLLGGKLMSKAIGGAGMLASKGAESAMEATLGSATRSKIGSKSVMDAKKERDRLDDRVKLIDEVKEANETISQYKKDGVDETDEKMILAGKELDRRKEALKKGTYTQGMTDTEKEIGSLKDSLAPLVEELAKRRESDTPPSSTTT